MEKVKSKGRKPLHSGITEAIDRRALSTEEVIESIEASFNSYVYLAEDASHGISLVLYALRELAQAEKRELKLVAARNAKSHFHTALSASNVKTEWLDISPSEDYPVCGDIVGEFKKHLTEKGNEREVDALYITSPDHLGVFAQIKELSALCHEKKMLLIVDNTAGLYLNFLTPSLFPTLEGADICINTRSGAAFYNKSLFDKTLIFVNKKLRLNFNAAKNSTIKYISALPIDKSSPLYSREKYIEKIKNCIEKLDIYKQTLTKIGVKITKTEPLRITVNTKNIGYHGVDISKILALSGVSVLYSDPDYISFLADIDTPGNIDSFISSFLKIPPNAVSRDRLLCEPRPFFEKPTAAITPRQALASVIEYIPIEKAEGRILARMGAGNSCASLFVAPGEVINIASMDAMDYYGVTHLAVVKQG